MSVILRQVYKAAFPVVFFTQDKGSLRIFAICEKLYGHAVRTFAIAVVVVNPNLVDIDGDDFRCMGIGNGKTIFDIALNDGLFVTFNLFFCYRIGNFVRCSCFVSRHVFEGTRPVIFF